MPPQASCPASPKQVLLSWKTEMLITSLHVSSCEKPRGLGVEKHFVIQYLPCGQHLINVGCDKMELDMTSLCHL